MPESLGVSVLSINKYLMSSHSTVTSCPAANHQTFAPRVFPNRNHWLRHPGHPDSGITQVGYRWVPTISYPYWPKCVAGIILWWGAYVMASNSQNYDVLDWNEPWRMFWTCSFCIGSTRCAVRSMDFDVGKGYTMNIYELWIHDILMLLSWLVSHYGFSMECGVIHQ